MTLELVNHDQLENLKSAFREFINIPEETSNSLKNAILDCLSHPGSFVRGQICMASTTKKISNNSLSMAVGIEYFHLASLLLDDLPCMDNAEQRRGHLCLHRKYGEANAILTALSLINRSYSLFWSVIQTNDISRQVLCSALIEKCLGISGVLNGQSQDLNYTLQGGSRRLIAEIAERKTGRLFELSMVLPAIIEKYSETEILQIKKLSRIFGRIYQVLDDYKDYFAERNYFLSSTQIKTPRDFELSRPNMLHVIGIANSEKYLNRLLKLSDRIVLNLSCNGNLYFYKGILEHFKKQTKFFHTKGILRKEDIVA